MPPLKSMVACLPGDVLVRVREYPVVLQRTADRAAILAKFAHRVVADDFACAR